MSLPNAVTSIYPFLSAAPAGRRPYLFEFTFNSNYLAVPWLVYHRQNQRRPEAATIDGRLKQDVKAPLHSNQIKSRQAGTGAGGGLQP
jgi:hypothetical protein